MTVEIISWSISTKVWDRAGIELATPGSAVSLASVARHVTDCATRPSSTHNICFGWETRKLYFWYAPVKIEILYMLKWNISMRYMDHHQRLSKKIGQPNFDWYLSMHVCHVCKAGWPDSLYSAFSSYSTHDFATCHLINMDWIGMEYIVHSYGCSSCADPERGKGGPHPTWKITKI